MKQKMKLEKASGSVLIFTLIMMFMLLALALGVLSTTAIERKLGGATGKSVVAFQVADSGAEAVLNVLRKQPPSTTLTNAFSSGFGSGCSGSGVANNLSSGNYTITFQDVNGNPVLCSATISSVYQIKSVGMYSGASRAVQVAVAADFWTLQTGNSANILNTNSGNVGIGTTSPSEKLNINMGSIGIDGDYAGNGRIVFRNTDTTYYSGGHQWEIYPTGGSDGSLIFFDRNTMRNTLLLGNNGNIITGGDVTTNGDFYDPALPATGANNYLCFVGSGGKFGTCSSLRSMKKDIQDLNLGLETLLKLRPVSFNWKESNQSDLGFIAEEVNEVNPLLSTYDQQGQLTGVKYSQISALLTKSVQEQQDEIGNLKSQIDKLKTIVCLDHPESDYCKN